MSYSDATVIGVDLKTADQVEVERKEVTKKEDDKELCPYAAHGVCHYGDNCVYIHGDQCDLCGKAVLHPGDREQQEKHKEVSNTLECNENQRFNQEDILMVT